MPVPAPDAALDALRRLWGYEHFRSGQAEAIGAVLAGRDVLAVLPTGGGKSLIYQVPAVVQPGVALVVSPLVALMQDQVAALQRRGVAAAMAHSGLGRREIDQLWTDVEFGRYRVLYLTPERLQTEMFQARAARFPVSLLAVDEAHCISEWGHSFRPAYREIASTRGLLSGPEGRRVPVVAVTATATPEVRRDIVAQLDLRDPEILVRGFDRPNLVWSVHPVENKERQVREVFEGVPGSGLVYAGTRRGTEQWAERLSRLGISAEAYHAGLDAARRSEVQRRWLEGETRVIAATSAFGMGIDKPDVRAVVHIALPPTLEAYYQEAGRAGRDGQRAYAALVVGPTDDRLPRAMIESSYPTAEDIQAVYAAAASLGQVAIGSQPERPVVVALDRLVEAAGVSIPIARAAAEHLSRAGVWRVESPLENALALCVESVERLRAAEEAASPALAAFVTELLRHLPPSVYGAWGTASLDRLAEATGLAPARVRAGLDYLTRRGVLEHLSGDGLWIEWLQPRGRRVALVPTDLERGRQHALQRFGEVVRYAEGVGCRRQHLLAYFGESAPSRCGRCDVCLGRHRPDAITPSDSPHLRRMLEHAAEGDAYASWLTDEALSPRRRNGLADWLVSEEMLRLVDPLAPVFEITPKGLRSLRQTQSGPPSHG